MGDKPSKGEKKTKSSSYLEIYCSLTAGQIELNRKIVSIEHVEKIWVCGVTMKFLALNSG